MTLLAIEGIKNSDGVVSFQGVQEMLASQVGAVLPGRIADRFSLKGLMCLTTDSKGWIATSFDGSSAVRLGKHQYPDVRNNQDVTISDPVINLAVSDPTSPRVVAMRFRFYGRNFQCTTAGISVRQEEVPEGAQSWVGVSDILDVLTPQMNSKIATPTNDRVIIVDNLWPLIGQDRHYLWNERLIGNSVQFQEAGSELRISVKRPGCGYREGWSIALPARLERIDKFI